jgi:lysozyme
MKASPAAIALIARFEGFRSRPYKVGSDPWTIGYGETRGIGPGSGPWTERYARQRLLVRVNRDFAPAVDRWRRKHKLRWTQSQFDAMVSVAYNLGAGMFNDRSDVGSSLRRALLAGRGVRAALMLYRMPGSQFEQGLARRRDAEADLYQRKPPRLARLRAELAHRRAQLARERTPGTRRFLMRRIRQLKSAITKEKKR